MNFIIQASYFAAAFLFIFGLKRMSSPVTARSGIIWAGVGMVVATLVTLAVADPAHPKFAQNLTLILLALLVGNAWAWWQGKRVPMTSMPQMVALFNGMGGASAAAIAAMELYSGKAHSAAFLSLAVLGGLIGAVSFSGSLVAWAKLEGVMQKSIRFGAQQLVNLGVLAGTIGLGGYLVYLGGGAEGAGHTPWIWIHLFFLGALLFGFLMTVPIGGADMPVVISLYNAFTGMAVGFEGFVLQNPAMIIAGVLVGSAGTLLTLLMATAMNRSIRNILFTHFGEVDASAGAGEIKGSLKPAEAGDAAVSMRYAAKVIIAPGYGLAVAQAQHKLYEFVTELQEAGVEVKFAIHPVAGRMPGHMNVLLAEAGVPYDVIYDMEDINEEFAQADAALVVGANDTVNPAARTNKSSPIFGMPILNVDKAKQVYVIKRGQGKGYSGVENELFYADNCNLVYGDAQAVMVKMIQSLKELG